MDHYNDEHKVDDVVLALLRLNGFKDTFGWRAWKSLNGAPSTASNAG